MRRGGDGEHFLREARAALGRRAVITRPAAMVFYTKGWRSGSGPALAVLQPDSLTAFWKCLRLTWRHRCAVIVQAANTGLTEGSTPHGASYDRPVVVINTLRVRGIYWLEASRQVVCLAGTTLHELTHFLDQHDRTPHSEIGSSCLGASVVGGIANNSGGALVRRGPAYTECSLYAWVDGEGTLSLVNHLGLTLPGDSDESRLGALERGSFLADGDGAGQVRACSARNYEREVRDVDQGTPARYNANPAQLCDASGCAGKLAVLAVRLDTFPRARRKSVFLVGTSRTDALQKLRVDALTGFRRLPDKAEYMHIECMRLARSHGRDTVFLLRLLGTARMPQLFRLKSRLEHLCSRAPMLGRNAPEKLLQLLAAILPCQLPKRLRGIADRCEHQLILEVSEDAVDELRAYLTPARCEQNGLDYIECDDTEAPLLLLHRFAAAGAALRYAVTAGREVADLVSLDIALPRNTDEWLEVLPPALSSSLVRTVYYGHFFCHVFHQDYLVKHGCDPDQVKAQLLELCASRGARYPAEHNVGHLYTAEEPLASFYRRIDPTNSLNPGVGGMSKFWRYGADVGEVLDTEPPGHAVSQLSEN